MTHKFNLPKYWWLPLGLLSALLVLIVACFWSGFFSMYQIWLRSETFTHGIAILPISLYLIYRERFKWYQIAPKPSWFGVLCLGGAALLYWIGNMVDVLVVQHFAVVLMLPVACLACLGWGFVRSFWFALIYLLFMVPAGEGLIPILQDITAYMSVKGIQWVGLPVYREGFFIEIPSGHFTVAEACSGMRYLIASVAVGVLYAYITYQKAYKRLIFVLFSILMPILANGIRAWGIIMLAHYSDYSLAVGFDHLIYGWLFFGVVIFLLFWIGSFWADAEHVMDQVDLVARCHPVKPLTWGALLLLSVGALQLPVLGNAWLGKINADPSPFQLTTIEDAHYQLTDSRHAWKPIFEGVSQELQSHYQADTHVYDVYIGGYLQQQQNKELINTQNSIYDPEQGQRMNSTTLEVDGFWLEEVVYVRDGVRFVIWYWYWIDEQKTVNPLKGKIFEVLGKLRGRPQVAVVAVRTFDADDYALSQTRERLKAFLQTMEPKISQQLSKMY